MRPPPCCPLSFYVLLSSASRRKVSALFNLSIFLVFAPYFVDHLWTFQWKRRIFFSMSKETIAETQKSEVLQGTLDLMVLKVLDTLGPQHGYGIARRIEQVSGQVLQLNEGTVYTSLCGSSIGNG